MLRILRAMQFLTLLINTAPSRLAEERHALDRALAECSTALTETVVRLCALPGEVASGISPDVIAAKINESLRQQFLQSTIPQTGEALAVVAVQMKRTVAEFQQASTAVNQVHRNVTSETDQAVRRIESSVRSALTASERASKDLTATFLHEYRWSIAMIAAVSLLAGVLFGIAFQNWRMSPLAEEPVPVVAHDPCDVGREGIFVPAPREQRPLRRGRARDGPMVRSRRGVAWFAWRGFV